MADRPVDPRLLDLAAVRRGVARLAIAAEGAVALAGEKDRDLAEAAAFLRLLAAEPVRVATAMG